MKYFFSVLLIILFANNLYSQTNPRASDYTIELARTFSKDLFDLNGVPYLSPMVEAVNATSNARFFTAAYVPRKVSKPYFRVSVNAMTGFVNESQRFYSPSVPTDSFELSKVSRYGELKLNIFDPSKSEIIIRDTAGLINYLFKTVLFDGMKSGQINPPKKASTILGPDTVHLRLDNAVLRGLVEQHPIYAFLPQELQDTLLSTMGGIPSFYTLPAGGDLNTIIAGVPQFEIGSLYGTELLLRFIPPTDLGEYIGKFAFWGFGLKHSISQYFYDDDNIYQDPMQREEAPPFDLAAQFVYQGTYLKNQVGLTQSDLKANATILSFNLHASKSFENIIDVYTGFAIDHIAINSKFKYYLPIETQFALGLLRAYYPNPDDQSNVVILPPEPPEFPGDNEPQTTNISLKDTHFKWTVGLRKDFRPISLFLDYSIGKFNIISFGLAYTF